MLANVVASVRPDWPAIKADYLAGIGSFRELAVKYDVSFHTLAKRAKREGWTDEMATLGNAVATARRQKALETASEQGAQLVLDSAGLVSKSIVLVEIALGEIERKLGVGTSSASELRSLIAALKDAVGLGRQTFGLDSEPPAQMLHLHVMRPTSTTRVIDVDAEENALAIGG